MHFRMHENGLQYFNPRDGAFTFVNIVSKNIKHFTKRKINDREVSRQLYKTLVCVSTKYFRLSVQSHQIKNCPVTVQNIDDAIKNYVKDLDALKSKTTGIKPSIVARDQMQVSIEILKLHREVFLTADIFFVKKSHFS